MVCIFMTDLPLGENQLYLELLDPAEPHSQSTEGLRLKIGVNVEVVVDRSKGPELTVPKDEYA